MVQDESKVVLEAILLAADRPLTLRNLVELLTENGQAPTREELRALINALQQDWAERGGEIIEVASGYRLQVAERFEPWIARLWEEKPPRYSRALLETLALIAYRQPITRGDIEEVRGVSVRTNIIRTLQEREWIRVVGHRDVPGKPALFGTTKAFLDYFNLSSLDDLPSLAEIKDMDSIEPELDLEPPAEEPAGNPDSVDAGNGTDGDAAAEAESVESAGAEPGVIPPISA